MTQPSKPMPIPLVRHVDSVCDQFEADWKAGKQPRIEKYLGTGPEPERSAILRALLQLEMDLLSHRNLRPEAAAYRKRFPQHGSLVDAAVQSALQRTAAYNPSQQASIETSVPRDSAQNPRVPPPNKPVSAPLPKRIGRFEILESLGQGAFGQVFRARAIRSLIARSRSRSHCRACWPPGRTSNGFCGKPRLRPPSITPIFVRYSRPARTSSTITL